MNLPNELILENEQILEAYLPWMKSLKLIRKARTSRSFDAELI